MLKLYNELQPITKLATHPHIQYVIHHYFSAIPSHGKLIYKTYKCELYISYDSFSAKNTSLLLTV